MQMSEIADTTKILGRLLLKADFQGIQRLQQVNSLFDPKKIVWNFSHLDQLFHSVDLVPPTASPSPLARNEGAIQDRFKIDGAPDSLAAYLQERRVKSFLVLKDGQVRFEDTYLGTDPSDRHISWSMAKSVTSLLLAILIDRGHIPEEALEAEVQTHVPLLAGSAYDGVRLIHVLTMSSGVLFNEDYLDYHSDINRMGRIIGVGGSMDAFAATLKRRWAPGRYCHYVSVDTHVIGMMIRALTGEKMIDLLNTHVFGPMDLEHPGFFLADETGEPFILGGLNLSTRDYARIGQMMLQRGAWNGTRIVSEAWVDRMTTQSAPPPDPETAQTPRSALGYGFQWWLPPSAMEGEFFGIGIYGQYIYVNRPCGVVIAQNAADTRFDEGDGAVSLWTLKMFRQIAQDLA